jgi:uncharacterized protein YcaQ
MKKISQREARLAILSAQCLLDSPPSLGCDPVQSIVEHLGYVQIDTIAVVERAHHHVLWTRLEGYAPDALERALSQRRSVFEYWSHAASYLPMRDFRFSLPRKREYAKGKRHWFTPTPDHKHWRRRILARIRREGPALARDFAAPEGKKSSGWFDWKPAKQALEQLFMEGELMVAGRRRFEKVYDLSERVVPAGIDTRYPNDKEMARYLIQSSLRAFALARPGEITYLRAARWRESVAAEGKRMLKEGEIRELKVEGCEGIFWAPGEGLPVVSPAIERAKILSPFDNLVIQRRRLKQLFGFDYTIECYLPESKRRFGYFCLPVLLGDKFVGRVDAKADRAEGVLKVRSFHWEESASRDASERIDEALESFARFNGCERVEMPR